MLNSLSWSGVKYVVLSYGSMLPGLVLSRPPEWVRRASATAAVEPYTCDRSRNEVTALTCCRGLLVLVPVLGAKVERWKGGFPLWLGSLGAAAMLSSWPEVVGVRSRSWSMNWPKA